MVLEVNNLTKIFETRGLFSKPESFTAVNNISFQLNKGEILGLLGPNGAGKTTTIQMLLGLLTPTSGTIRYFQKDFVKHRTEIMQNVTFASTYLKLPGSLTVEENLKIYSKIYSIPSNVQKERIEKNIEFFDLSKIRNRLAKNLSAGQFTRLMLAKAFLPNPKIVLLDEPTASLDPDIAIKIRKFILNERNNSGTSIIFTSHNMPEVEELCDRVLILKDGNIVASETPFKLASQIKTSKVQFLISSNIDKLIKYAEENQLKYKIKHHYVEIDITDSLIPDLINDITKLEIKYSQISIEKPSLRDYFLEMVNQVERKL